MNYFVNVRINISDTHFQFISKTTQNKEAYIFFVENYILLLSLDKIRSFVQKQKERTQLLFDVYFKQLIFYKKRKKYKRQFHISFNSTNVYQYLWRLVQQSDTLPRKFPPVNQSTTAMNLSKHCKTQCCWYSSSTATDQCCSQEADYFKALPSQPM